MKQNNSAIVYASIAGVSWSTVATAFKIALMHLTHFGMLLIASCTALALFITLLTIRKKWHLVISLSGRKWLYYALLGLLNPVGYYLVLFKAYDLLPAQIAQPVNYIWPIMLLILLALFTHHPIPSSKYIGMFISLLGVTLISWGTGYSGKETISYYGLLLALLSALLWAIYWMIQNKQKEKTDSCVALFVSFLFGTVYLLVASYGMVPMAFTIEGILSGIYIGGFEMGIPFICFGIAMRRASNPALINQLCYLAPFLSLFFISVILNEQITLTTYAGLTLIVSGIIFNQYLIPSGKAIRNRMNKVLNEYK